MSKKKVFKGYYTKYTAFEREASKYFNSNIFNL
jgi:hypothetical protein